MKLRWTQRARLDLIEIGRYIARDKPEASRRWVQHLREQARRAVEQPRSHRRVPEFLRDDLREILVRDYRIVYKFDEEVVWIVTIFEGHRLFPKDIVENTP